MKTNGHAFQTEPTDAFDQILEHMANAKEQPNFRELAIMDGFKHTIRHARRRGRIEYARTPAEFKISAAWLVVDAWSYHQLDPDQQTEIQFWTTLHLWIALEVADTKHFQDGDLN